MACEDYNPNLLICGKTPCKASRVYCQRVAALSEMKESLRQRPSIENVFGSIILFEDETIDLNEVQRRYSR